MFPGGSRLCGSPAGQAGCARRWHVGKISQQGSEGRQGATGPAACLGTLHFAGAWAVDNPRMRLATMARRALRLLGRESRARPSQGRAPTVVGAHQCPMKKKRGPQLRRLSASSTFFSKCPGACSWRGEEKASGHVSAIVLPIFALLPSTSRQTLAGAY